MADSTNIPAWLGDLDLTNREILLFEAVGVPVGQSAKISVVSRARKRWNVSHLLICEEGTDGGSADWIVNDIKIGAQSQFVQTGDLPGDMFATTAIDTYVHFNDLVFPNCDAIVIVTYIGTRAAATFRAALIGQ